MKNTFIRTTIIVAIILTLITMVSPASASDWSQFQKDEINTGITTDNGPISDPVAVWYEQTTGTGMGGIDTAPVIADGQVFVIDYQAIVWAYNKTTGEENWNTSCSQPGTFELSTPAYSNGILYAATSAADFDQGYCKVTALYTNNGTIRESITLRTQNGYQLNSPITYSDDKIYVGDWNGSASSTNGTGIYYCFNADNVSEIIWEYQPNRITGYYWAGAAIVGDYIIFGDDTANVTCLDKNTGALVDHFNVSQQCGCSDPVEKIRSSILWVESTGHIYFTAMYRDNANDGYGTGHIYAVPFDSTTGDLGGNDAVGGGDCEWNNSIKNSKSTPVYYDGRLYVGSGYRMYQTNHTGKMCCLNASDGKLVWEWNDPYGRVKASPALSVVDGRKFIYFTTNVRNASAYCLEDMGDDYEIKWIWNPPEPDNQYILHGMAISDGIIYFGTDYGRLFALQDQIDPVLDDPVLDDPVLDDPDWPQFHLDIANTGNSSCDAPDDNTTKWISDNISAVASSQAMIVGEKVFVYADDNIIALDRSDGSVLWNTSILPASELWGHQSSAWNDDKVFIGSGSNVWCLDDSNGSIIWNITLPGTDPFVVNSAPTVSDGLVFIGDYNNAVYYALDEATGAIDHSYTVGGNAISTVTVDDTDDLVFFGDGGNNTVYCADKNSNTTIWQKTLDGYVGSSVAINAQNDLVYIATYPFGLPGSVYAFNEFTGTQIWNSSMTAGTNSVPTIAYGNVYVSIDNAVYCFDALTGAEVWSITGWGSWTDSPAAADGKIFVGSVGSWGGNPDGIAALDPATGAVIWQYGSTAGSPVSVSDSDSDPIVVTIGSDGVVYAFGSDPVSDDPDWPQFHLDTTNTGNSPCDAPDDNTTKWISDNISAVASSQAMIVGEKVFVYADDNIIALDRSDGSVLWNTSILPASELWGHQSSAWNDNKVFIGSGSNVWCLDDSNGSIIWNITLPGTDPFVVNSAPTVSDGLVFIGDYNNAVYYALDEATGAIDHSYTVGGNAISTVAVDDTDDLVFFGDGGNNTVYCADKNSNTTIWQKTLDGYVGSSVAINAQNDLVYIATYPFGLPGSVYAFNEFTGTQIWNSSMTAGTNSVPTIAYGNVYVSIDNAVYCFDALTGAEVWSITGWGSWTDSPAAADGKIFVGSVGSWGGNPDGIAALDPATGAVIWQYGSTAGSPVSVSDSDSDPIVVTIGSDGVVYAFGTPTASGNVSSETISIGSATVDVNDTVVIPVTIANATDIQQVSLDIVYDPDVVSIVNITVNESIPSSTISYTVNAGNATIVLTNDNITVTGSTPLIDITFQAADNNATTVLDLHNVELTDDDGSHVPDTIVNGNIMVCIKGDFNYNDRVDIGDVAKVAFMVAGNEPKDPRADFNNNGRVDIGDAAKISFYLAGKVSEL